MKIAFLVHVFPRLHNTFIINEIVELIKRGHQVSVFSIYKPVKLYEDLSGPNLKHIQEVFYFQDIINIWFRGFLFLINKIERFFKISEQEKYHHFFNKNIKALNKVAEIIKKGKFDIIHAGFGNRPAELAMVLSDLTGLPFTFECHAFDLFADFNFSQEKIQKVSKIFTISNYNKKYLIDEYHCQPEKIVVKRVVFNRNYCDSLSFNISRKDNLIVSVCRLHSIKGIEYGIDAFAELSKQRTDLKYLIIGDGPLRKTLHAKTKKLGLIEKITFMGDIPNIEALKYLREAALSIIPSVVHKDGDRDGIPIALIESMYLGTPVISTKISGIPELIDDGINGFLTEPENVNQLAEKIELLLSDSELRKSMGEKAKEKIDREFNVDLNMNKFIKGLENCIVAR